ncbi:MAG: helix-turn-helix domain-containing protein, partial [Gammaproteobacteria bacterium]|nr:helix-turn-helix domain-containing protein [Gammaproteobacteria bacterium]
MSTRAGHTLQRARETQDITLEAAAQVTYIHLRYLKALEAGNLDALPSRAQARGFLRAYAEYLKLDPAPLLAMVKAGDDQPFATPATAETAEDVESEEEAARDLFVKIGSALRQQRELLGLTLESIEQQIHVRVHYLQALETGDLSGLPSPVQGRGMLNNYASFLGL